MLHSSNKSQAKTAIVHDYFNQFGGAEKVVEVWLQLYPKAIIFTSIFIPQHFKDSPEITKAWQENRIKTSILQPFFTKTDNGITTARWTLKFFKHFFWAFPLAMWMMKITGFKNILISSTYCAKNIQLDTQPDTKLVHYCHSPTRFLHGLITETDHASLGFAYRILIPFFAWWLRILDLQAVKNLNNHNCIWLANSNFIQQTIADVYKVKSQVLFPPIQLDRFLNIERKIDTNQPFYLCHGRISFHKRIDLAISACLLLGKKLVISGTSGMPQEMDSLKKIVDDAEKNDPTKRGLITFLGRTSDQQIDDLMATCAAFLFPGKEDFGIAPIEMLAAGVPLIAYQAGGALEYVKDGENGIFFEKQSVDNLAKAMEKFEGISTWNTQSIKNSSLPFSYETHTEGLEKAVA